MMGNLTFYSGAIMRKGVSTAIGILGAAYRSSQESKVASFLHSVELRYEAMTLEDQKSLEEHLESEAGKKLLADYAEAVTTTSCNRAHASLALLYCNDDEFRWNDEDKRIFISAMKGVDDKQLDMFLKAVKNPPQENKNLPYERAGIHQQNKADYEVGEWGEAGINVLINELINRRLLLPDPNVSPFSDGDGGWAVWYGITSKSRAFSALILKADALTQKT